MRLKDVCTIQMGYTPRGRLEAVEIGGIPAIQLRDFPGDGRISSNRLSHYNLDGSTGRYLVRPGDVLFRSRGERNTAIAADENLTEPAVAVSPLFVLRPDRSAIEPRYLEWVINQSPAQRYFDSRARGTRLRMIPKSSLDNLEIELPDLETQRAIVEIDALAMREHELSTLAAEKKRKLISHLLVKRTLHSPSSGRQKGKTK